MVNSVYICEYLVAILLHVIRTYVCVLCPIPSGILLNAFCA